MNPAVRTCGRWRAGLFGPFAATGLVLVLVCAPLTAGAAPQTAKWNAPFSGHLSKLTLRVANGSWGCGQTSTVDRYWVMNKTSGVIRIAMNGSLSPCNATSTEFVDYRLYDGILLGPALTLNRSASYESANWTFSYHAHLSVRAAPGNQTDAGVEIIAISCYQDVSTHHCYQVPGGGGPNWQYVVYNWTFNGSVTLNARNLQFADVSHIPIPKGATIRVGVWLQVELRLQSWQASTASASGSLDMGTNGHFARLDSVVVI